MHSQRGTQSQWSFPSLTSSCAASSFEGLEEARCVEPFVAKLNRFTWSNPMTAAPPAAAAMPMRAAAKRVFAAIFFRTDETLQFTPWKAWISRWIFENFKKARPGPWGGNKHHHWVLLLDALEEGILQHQGSGGGRNGRRGKARGSCGGANRPDQGRVACLGTTISASCSWSSSSSSSSSDAYSRIVLNTCDPINARRRVQQVI